ncbi:MAG: hypothetical protein AMS19_08560 [Gemmatimonas sp. SG8_23]|jgi:hypothetical protein|nr:MAG: hypothetical protein AMS19_08560 [Gemmatimonas sp. SG8_23]
MSTWLARVTAGWMVLMSLSLIPQAVEAQGRGNGRGQAERAAQAGGWAGFSVELSTQIRDFYAVHATGTAQPLPPGIRKRLERGKPLPPGIAKKMVPQDLHAMLRVPPGYEIVEVGLDVLLVEVATAVVHDVLMDVVR